MRRAAVLASARLGVLRRRPWKPRPLCSSSSSSSSSSGAGSSGKKLAEKHAGHRVGAVLSAAALGFTSVLALDFLLDFPEPAAVTWRECQASEAALAAFGANMKRGWIWDGAVTDWQASITMPVSGDAGEGTVFGRFIKSDDGEWQPILIGANVGGKLVTILEAKGKFGPATSASKSSSTTKTSTPTAASTSSLPPTTPTAQT